MAWDKISIGDDKQSLVVPINADNVSAFSIFGDYPDIGNRSWRASELVDDYVLLDDNSGYGMVDDLVFSGEGELLAVLVRPDLVNQPGYHTPGLFAYPYYGYDYGFDPGAPNYTLPYTKDEIDAAEPFETS